MRTTTQMEITVTPRQLEALQYIADYRQEHNYSPTQKEIVAHLGVAVQTAREHVLGLKDAGALESNRWGAPRDIFPSLASYSLLTSQEGRDVG